eukprot:gene9010-10637_t
MESIKAEGIARQEKLGIMGSEGENGSSALIEAASEGHHDIVHFLVNNGAIVDQKDKADADLNLTDMWYDSTRPGFGELSPGPVEGSRNIGSVKSIKPEDTVVQKNVEKLSWLGEVLTQRCISPELVRLCEEKLVLQEGFGSPLTLTRTSDQHFHRAYLASLGITALGLCETLLTLHADLHSEFSRQLGLKCGIDRGTEAAACAALTVVMVDYCGVNATWGKDEEIIPA